MIFVPICLYFLYMLYMYACQQDLKFILYMYVVCKLLAEKEDPHIHKSPFKSAGHDTSDVRRERRRPKTLYVWRKTL